MKIPNGSALGLYAPPGCGFQTGVVAILYILKVRPGDLVAIFGTDSVGMAAVMMAPIPKAYILIAVDINLEGLKITRDLGAKHCLQVGCL